MSAFRYPDDRGQFALVCGLMAFLMTMLARTGSVTFVFGAVVALGVVAWRPGRRRWIVCVGLLALLTGSLSSIRETTISETRVPVGPITVTGIAVGDGRDSLGGAWVLVEPRSVVVEGRSIPWAGPTLLVNGDVSTVSARSSIEVSGTLRSQPGNIRGQNYAGVLHARRVAVVDVSTGAFAVADRARSRVAEALAPWSHESAGGLVSGFLIGDTSSLSSVDQQMLREAGLSHFVAVSGSNVAMFLGLWWVIAAPFAFGPRRRAVGGLVGVSLFVIMTRWEPSVVRAGAMAIIVLLTRAVGYPMTAWSALGAAVTGIVLVSPELVESVGFQLSIAATLGVMALAGLTPTPWRWLNAAVAATIGAQMAVAPILLWHFGNIPLMAPIANILAVPAVTLSTMAGGVGVIAGWEPVLAVSVTAARYVLWLAEVASGWPQLSAVGFALVMLLAGLTVWLPTRPLGVAVAVGFLVLQIVSSPDVVRPSIIALDVGQGDAILLLGPETTILIDGGPDPGVMVNKLREYDVESVDLLVITHPHEDHQGGIDAVVDRWPIGAIWHSGWPEASGSYVQISQRAQELGIAIGVPDLGRYTIGGWTLDVLGPQRRYADANDQSVVIRATYGGVSILLTGDVEERAQRELGQITADILKVPHHGGATSDLDWLGGSGAQVAIISYGENTFGHPTDVVLEELRSSGMVIRETGLEGDIVIPLGLSLGIGASE